MAEEQTKPEEQESAPADPPVDPSGEEHNKLLPALQKERKRRQEAEERASKLEEEQKAREEEQRISQAKSAEEIENLRKEFKAERETERRNHELEILARDEGVDLAFVKEADDGSLSPADVVKAASERQKKLLDKHGATKTPNLGGGASPGPGSKRVFKRSEIRDMSTAEYREKRTEITRAMQEGRIIED